jgi:hypothetical protein
MICCGIDANDKIVLLAWGLVPVENQRWWTWFLHHFKLAFFITVQNQHTFVSDREKGMANAVAELYPNAIHLHCCQHIADNLQQRFGNKVKLLFWRICEAKTLQLFEAEMVKMRELSIDAFNYFFNIDNKLWTKAYSQYPQFSHNTSNIVESLNSAWNKYRQMPPLQLLDGIYLLTSEMWFRRRTEGSKSESLADVPMAKFKDRFKASRRYRVYPSNEAVAQVEDPESGRKWIVNLNEKHCDCTAFYQFQSLCSYAIAAARILRTDPVDYFDNLFTAGFYRDTY